MGSLYAKDVIKIAAFDYDSDKYGKSIYQQKGDDLVLTLNLRISLFCFRFLFLYRF